MAGVIKNQGGIAKEGFYSPSFPPSNSQWNSAQQQHGTYQHRRHQSITSMPHNTERFILLQKKAIETLPVSKSLTLAAYCELVVSLSEDFKKRFLIGDYENAYIKYVQAHRIARELIPQHKDFDKLITNGDTKGYLKSLYEIDFEAFFLEYSPKDIMEKMRQCDDEEDSSSRNENPSPENSNDVVVQQQIPNTQEELSRDFDRKLEFEDNNFSDKQPTRYNIRRKPVSSAIFSQDFHQSPNSQFDESNISVHELNNHNRHSAYLPSSSNSQHPKEPIQYPPTSFRLENNNYVNPGSSVTKPTSNPGTTLPYPVSPNELPKTSEFNYKFPLSNTISVQQLDGYLRQFSSNVLLFDIRTRTEFEIGHLPSKNVVCIEPFALSYPLKQDLSVAMQVYPESEQRLYQSREKYELIVFYDWDSTSIKDREELEMFFDIFYTSPDKGKSLKRMPCLLIGGLKEWTEKMGRDTIWRRKMEEFKTPKMPQGAVSRISVTQSANTSSSAPLGSNQSYHVVQGMVQPAYSHISTASIMTTAGSQLPPVTNTTTIQPPSMHLPPSKNQQQSLRYQRIPQAPPHQLPMLPTNQSPIPQLQFDEFVTGLVNLGNTCYMNCILQCLVGTVRLSGVFFSGRYHPELDSRLGYKGQLAHAYARLVRIMYQAAAQVGRTHFTYIAPKDFKAVIGRLSDQFMGYEQQDCHEFLNFLLDGLHEDLNIKGNKPRLKPLNEKEEAKRESMSVHTVSAIEWARHLNNNESPISWHFQGQYLSRLECRVCGCRSTTYNPFSCLSIPIPSHKSHVNLEDCFEQFTRPEVLDGDDAWSCPRCKKRQPTIKTMRISRMPDFLIIHLKRFKHHGGIWGSNKLTTFVKYPCNEAYLDLLPYWLPANDLQTLDHSLHYQSPPFKYKLYGVANHFGTLKGGHYTSYVHREGSQGWCSFDDTRVRTRVSPNEVVNKNAYVLFYERI